MSEQPVIAGASLVHPCPMPASAVSATSLVSSRSQCSPRESPVQAVCLLSPRFRPEQHIEAETGCPVLGGPRGVVSSSCGCLSGHASISHAFISPLLEEQEHTQKIVLLRVLSFSHLAFHLQVWLSPHSTSQFLMRSQTLQMWRKLWNEYKAMILTLRKSTLTILWYLLLSTLLSW